MMLAGSATSGTAPSFCGGSSLRNRSYLLPAHFPFPPIRLVMERVAGTCDLYSPHRTFCRDMERGKTFEPEYHVREAIASFLTGCLARSCATIDLGANNGWFTAYMLSLGASVTAVEPMPDLARAARETVDLNCWSNRAQIITGLVDAQPGGGGTADLHKLGFKGWRAYNGKGEGLEAAGLSSIVPILPLDEVFARAGTREFELFKLDADGPEGAWLHRIEELISAGRLSVKSMIIEGHNTSATDLHRLQQVHGYDAYLLDMHIDRRFLNSEGIDTYSSFREDCWYVNLPTRDDGIVKFYSTCQPLPEFLEEMYSIRLMRHVYHFSRNMTVDDWKVGRALTRFKWSSNQYVFTTEKLLEPRFEHSAAKVIPSREKRAQSRLLQHTRHGVRATERVAPENATRWRS
ncbi:hypothetical protein AB1Y20_009325 [Prymnesium parvum]|uniref:Methyltransferase FkbM domain-containing protein n=1 Tax=Prymnesium parvum TaxID=97485 RepID=A0AB34K021_PRYPA